MPPKMPPMSIAPRKVNGLDVERVEEAGALAYWRSPMNTPRPDPSRAFCSEGVPHHWLIAAPDGPTSPGVCRHCGASREFNNVDQWTGREEGQL